MLALSTWLLSGNPSAVFAPSRSLTCTGSPSRVSKLPAARVKPIGAACRWSWNTEVKYSSWVASIARFACHENGVKGSQVHLYCAEHRSPENSFNG